MASLAQLTDTYLQEEPDREPLPVEPLYTSVPVDADGRRRVYINTAKPAEGQDTVSSVGSTVDKILNKLFRDDDQRYQLWPEKVIRGGLTAAGNVMSGQVPQWAIDKDTGDVHTSPQMIEKAQEISALAGTGGIAGADATLGATPFLRPALKYKDKIYKGKPGQQHQDVIPKELYPEFEQMAMNGEDISHYNFGFMNHKGQFLDREKALEYAIMEGLVDAHAGQYGALTSTLMADSSKPGVAIEAMGKTASPFYSAVERNVRAIPQDKMTGDQWLGTLSNKPGVKPEELQWTGLKSFLEENKGKPITKEQIAQHLEQNKVGLKEVEKGSASLDKSSSYYDKKLERVLNSDSRGTFDDMHLTLSNDAKAYQTLMRKHPELKTDDDWASTVLNSVVKGGGETKYHSYQLPGGENYREMLLTLPHESKINWKTTPEGHVTNGKYTIKNEPFQDQPNYITYGEGGRRLSANDNLEHAKNLIEMAGNNEVKSNLYRSSHWDEPNILAHVRMNDRHIPVEFTAEEKAILATHKEAEAKMDAIRKEQHEVAKEINDASLDAHETYDTKLRSEFKAGHISMREFRTKSEEYQPENLKLLQDELQALRAKEDVIRKSLPEKPEQKNLKSLHLEEIQSDWHQQGRDKGYKGEPTNYKVSHIGDDGYRNYDNFKSKAEAEAYLKVLKEKGKVEPKLEAQYDPVSDKGVPDAPFKKNWHELALKRMVREAAEKGYDRLSWTPGEAQAARYDLSKQIDKLKWYKDGDNNYRISGVKNDAIIMQEPNLSSEKLASTVGKEMAKKIVDGAEKEQHGIISGLDLKIGGEGIKGFYDQIIPKSLEKMFKEHGVKVKQINLTEAPKYEMKNPILNKEGKEIFSVYKDGKFMADMEKSEAKHYIQIKSKSDKPSFAYYIDIPQSLKDHALKRGFPLFSAGVPVDLLDNKK